jgi:hypothetical protein
VKFLLVSKVMSRIRKKAPDPGGLRAARATACPRSAFAEFLLGGA